MSETSYTPRHDVYLGPPRSDFAMWQERREQAQRHRRRYEPIWALCQAYVANRQWVGWSHRDRRIVVEPNPQNRERHTVNVLTAYLMTNIGKLTADELMPQLLFRTDSVESERYARQANRALEYAWEEELDADEVLYETILRMCTYGLGAIQPGWNPSSGPVLAEGVPFLNGEPVLERDAQMRTVADNYGGRGTDVELRDVRGQIEWRQLSPHNLLPPPGVVHERDFPWLIVERPVSLERLRAAYPDKAGQLTEQKLDSADLPGLAAGMSDTDGTPHSSTGRLRGHAILYTGYELPTARHPKGRCVYWSQESMLEEKPQLPYEIAGRHYLGIRFFKYSRVADRFWPVGLIEPGIGPQRQRNRSRSQYIELKDRAGLGRIYTRPGALNIAQLPGGKVMEIVEVRPGSEIPTETVGLGPGPWMAQDIAMHDADIDKVMGIGQVTLGQGAPGGVSAYSAMALLAEQDDRRVGPIIKHTRQNVAWLVKFTLQDIRRYWGPQKQVLLEGEDGSLEAFSFNATKLPLELLVKVGRGAPVPKNQAAEVQKIFDLYDRAIAAGQPLPPQWLYDSLEQGRALPLPQTPQMVQEEKAEVENMLIARGGIVDVHATDDHNVHLAEHAEALAAHQLIPGMEEVVRALAEHMAEHEQAQQQAGSGASVPNLQAGFGAAGGSSSGVQQPLPTLPAPPAGGPQQQG